MFVVFFDLKFELSENDMNEIANLNIGWRHLLWAEVIIFKITEKLKLFFKNTIIDIIASRLSIQR